MAKELRIYRPNNNGNGAASAIQLSFKKENKFNEWTLFWTIAPQTGTDENGNAKFEWKAGTTLKLGEIDVGELISFLDGFQEFLGGQGKGLFHESPNGGNKVLAITRSDKGFYVKISGQTAEKKIIGPWQHSLSKGEAATLSTLLKAAVVKIYGW